jgi:SPP1 family predicted phage head-tail adaptor
MRAGKLSQRVRVERPVETQGASGAMTTTWMPVATVWAEVLPATTRMRERLAANQTLADMDTVVRMRYAPIIADIDATWRLRLDATVYNIIGAANVGMANREIEALCVSGRNDG